MPSRSPARSPRCTGPPTRRDAELRLTQQTAGNGVVTTQSFDPLTDRLTSILAGTGNAVENLSYTYDVLGNVLTRADANESLTETLTYDNLNRLTSATVDARHRPAARPSPTTRSATCCRSPMSAPTAIRSPARRCRMRCRASPAPSTRPSPTIPTATRPRASAAASPTPPTTSRASITQGSTTLFFPDDIDHQRFKQVAPEGGTLYFDAFGVHAELFVLGHLDVVRLSQRRRRHGRHARRVRLRPSPRAISTPTISARSPSSPTRPAPWWSATATTPGASAASPTAPTTPPAASPARRTRGFTGQEELSDVGLVHLNGRVYDSADRAHDRAPIPMVPDPMNGQAWNRYSYVGNNPLAFTDPSGYCFLGCGTWSNLGKMQLGTLVPAAPDARQHRRNRCRRHLRHTDRSRLRSRRSSAVLASTMIAGVTSGRLGKDVLRAGIVTTATVAAFAVVGSVTSGMPGAIPGDNGTDGTFKPFSEGHIANMIGHALVGCGQAAASGGKCGAGALAGAVTSAAGPYIYQPGITVSGLVANAALGGAGAVLGGGKFANGAVTGAFGYLFNSQAPCAYTGTCPSDGINTADGVFQLLLPVVGVTRMFLAEAAAVGIAEVGAAAEAAVGVDASIAKVGIQIPETTTIRYPDILTATTLEEVKNVARLANTQQLQDYLLYAQENNLTFNVWVRPSTTFTSTVKDLISSGQINLKYIPGTR